ncbi:MAG: hypothetical protein Q8J90_00885 [Gallionella sp.]|nr:hypothetical protein [Gallionella sp.]
MRKVHLVVCDLFLPADFAAEVCADLRLPALEKMLARGASAVGRVGNLPTTHNLHEHGGQFAHPTQIAPLSLEDHLCGLFGMPCQPNGYGKYATPDNEACHARFPHPNLPPLAGEGANETLREFHINAPIAPVSAAFDGLGEGCWLRADPVHLRLQREQLILLPDVEAGADEAGQLCATLNEHFAGQGMEFFAPHPQRWYVRVDGLPDIATVPLSQAAGRNVHDLLPKGRDAARWHQVFNEIQMLLFAHPVNEAREARGALPVNSLWLWGGGSGVNSTPQKTCDCISSDEALAGMFAAVAGIPFAGWPKQWRNEESCDRQLLVWTGLRSALQRGDLENWRAALQEFETGYAQPLWQALRAGKISQLQVDVLGGDRARRLLLTRADAWAFWRRARPLAQYAIV